MKVERKRRKLEVCASKQEQFDVLRSTGLSCVDSCKVIRRLQENDSGASTCKALHLAYAHAYPCYAQMDLKAATGEAVRIPMMNLPLLLQAKVDACPLYRAMLHEAMTSHHDSLTLFFYCEEVSGGNVLSALQSRKANQCYVSWLQCPVIVPREHVANVECREVVLHSKAAAWDG